MTTAIIGAGMAGLACAQQLINAGHSVKIFDKGRGPGGRMSTRRMNTPMGEVRWDHGAQFFTARGETFRAAVSNWKSAGAVAEWTGNFLTLGHGDGGRSKTDAKYVGTPGMNGIIRYLAEGCDVIWNKRAETISGTAGDWRITFEDGTAETGFEKIVVAIPAEQAADLLRSTAPSFAEEAGSIVSAPCWAVLLAYDAPLDAGFDGAKILNGPLSWIARNASKPGRGPAEAWVLHASADWSRENVNEQKDEVAAKLTRHFRAMSGAPAPVFSAAHRWLYAMVEHGAATPCRWDANLKIGACGDWRIAPRVEAAWTSGHALALEILESI